MDDLQFTSDPFPNAITNPLPDDSLIDPCILQQDYMFSQQTTNTGESYVPGLNYPRLDLGPLSRFWPEQTPSTPGVPLASPQSSFNGSMTTGYIYETPPTATTPSITGYQQTNFQFRNYRPSSRASAYGDTSSNHSTPIRRARRWSRASSRPSYARSHLPVPEFVQNVRPKEKCPVEGCHAELIDRAGLR